MDNTIDPTTGNDLQAQNLAKAIRQRESGGNYNAVGDAGTSHGGYQFQPATWKGYAKEVLGDENAEMTPANQNAVAYGKIKSWKDKGKSAAEIAAMWNAGEGIGDKWQDHKGKTTINGKVISYDTPQYVKDVTDLYQKYKGESPVNVIPTAEANNGQLEQPKKDFLQKAGDVVNSIFPGKQIGESLGNTIGAGIQAIKQGSFKPILEQGQENLNPKTVAKVAGDVGQVALTAAPMSAASSVMGRIGQAGLLGTGIGATQALKEGKTNVGDIAKQGLIGGTVGLATGGAGELLSKVAQHFPKSMIQGKFEGLSDSETQKFLKQNIGTKESLLAQAQNVVKTEGNKIDAVLQSPKYSSYVPTTNPFSELVKQFPEYQGKEGQLVDKIKSFISSNGQTMGEDRSTLINYVDKIVNGEANLFEQNQVRKVLDDATKPGFTKLAKSINPSAGHDLVMTFADFLRNEIKGTAKETIPMFDELKKSINIRTAVNAAAKKKVGGILRYSDIIPFLGGNMLAPGAGVGVVLANRAIENPAARFAGAKASQGLLKGSSTVAKNPLTIKALQGLFGGNANVH